MLNNLKPSSFPHLPHPKVHSSAERLLNRQFVQYQDLRYRRLADLCGYLSTFFLLVCVVQIFFSVAPGEIVMTVLQCLVLYSFCWHFTAVRDQHISWLKSQPKLEFLWTLEKLEADRHEHLAMCYKEIAVYCFGLFLAGVVLMFIGLDWWGLALLTCLMGSATAVMLWRRNHHGNMLLPPPRPTLRLLK